MVKALTFAGVISRPTVSQALDTRTTNEPERCNSSSRGQAFKVLAKSKVNTSSKEGGPPTRETQQ